MFLQQSQSGSDDLRFIIESPTGNKPMNQLLEMWSYDLAHTSSMIQQLPSIVNPIRGRKTVDALRDPP